MRVSTRSLQLQWLADVYRRQAELARIQKQVGSGRRINTAAEDPAGASQIVALRQGLNRLENYGANGETARRRLSLEENALDKFGDAVTRIRELAVEAGGGIQGNETRNAIATEMRELLATMVDIANGQDGEGRYLFAGNDVGEQPITIQNGIASYNGDDGARLQRIGDSRMIRESDPGSEVFFAIRDGNGTFSVEDVAGNQGTAWFTSATVADSTAWVADTYAITFATPTSYDVTDSGGALIASNTWNPGDAIAFAGVAVEVDGQPVAGDAFTVRPSVNRSVFETVQRMITALESDSLTPSGRAGFQNALNSALLDLDQGERHLSDVRSSVGARLAALDEQKSINEELSLQLETTLSSVRDVDYPQAVSELETQLTSLEAAQKIFAQTRALSLFDLL